MHRFLLVCLLLLPAFALGAPQAEADKEALKPLNVLIGAWKGTGQPEGTQAERQKGHWVETLDFSWKFEKEKTTVIGTITKGKHFKQMTIAPQKGELPLRLTAIGTADQKAEYDGSLKKNQLVFVRLVDEGTKIESLIFNLLHDNRITYRVETTPAFGTSITKRYQVGMTKDGVPFADIKPSERECIVSGGLGTSTVTHKGKTYYVCCSGCRDEFNTNPESYVKAWEAKRKK